MTIVIRNVLAFSILDKKQIKTKQKKIKHEEALVLVFKRVLYCVVTL